MFFSKVKTEQSAPHERRRSIRHATVMQLAKIRLTGGREELCLLRDVSPEGLKAEIYVTIASGERIEVELRTGRCFGGSVAWADGNMIGVAFDEIVPMSAMLAHCSFDDRVGKLRPPRLMVDLRGTLRIDFQDHEVAIGNISQAGVQITAPGPLHDGAGCMITLPGLDPRAATIRWCREDQAGLMLAEPLDYDQFAKWRGKLAA